MNRIRVIAAELVESFPILHTQGSTAEITLYKSSDQTSTLPASEHFQRADDRLMARILTDVEDYSLAESKLYFEEGNIISDERFIFVGVDSSYYSIQWC